MNHYFIHFMTKMQRKDKKQICILYLFQILFVLKMKLEMEFVINIVVAVIILQLRRRIVEVCGKTSRHLKTSIIILCFTGFLISLQFQVPLMKHD